MRIENEEDAQVLGHVLGIESVLRILAKEVASQSLNPDFLEDSLVTGLRRIEGSRPGVRSLFADPDGPSIDTCISEAAGVLRAVFAP